MKEIHLDRHDSNCSKDDGHKCFLHGFIFFFGGKYFMLSYNRCFLEHLRMKKGNYYIIDWSAWDEVVMMISHVLDEYKICDKYKISKSNRVDDLLRRSRIHGVKYRKYITHVNALYGTYLQWAIVTETPFFDGIYSERQLLEEYFAAKAYLQGNDLLQYLPQLEALHTQNFHLGFSDIEYVKTLESLRLSILHTIKNSQ